MTTATFIRLQIVSIQILILVFITSTAGADLSWTRCSPLPTDAFLLGAASHDSIAVAVGYFGTIVISTDSGANWRVVESPVQSRLFKVLWSGTQFVAVGSDGTVITSLDGLHWEAQETGIYFNELYSVAWNGTRYVAAGQNGLIIESTDGKTWNPCISGTDRYLFDVIWDGNRFIAVGGQYFETGTDSGTILVSTDGLSWETQVDSLTGCMQGIASSGTVHVAVSDKGIIYRCTANQSWTAQSTVAPYAFRGVIRDGTLFIAFGELGQIFWSPDGSTWTRKDAPFRQKIRGMTTCANCYLAVGENGLIISSTDGTTWTSHTEGTTLWLFDCVWTGSSFLAIGQQGTLLRSKDGTHWETLSSPTGNDLKCIAWDGKTCIISDWSEIHTSSDLVNWNSVWVPTNGPTIYTIASSGSRYIAAGGSYIAVSLDGKKWQLADSAMNATFEDAVWTGSEFILVGKTDGDTGLVATSQDGLVWDLTRVDSIGPLNSVVWTGTQVIASSTNNLCVSDDYLKWHIYPCPIMYAKLSYHDSTLYAFGQSGAILSTTDFIQWNNHDISSSTNIEMVCFSPTQAVAVGWFGAIYKAALESQNPVIYGHSHQRNTDIGQLVQIRLMHGEFDALGRKIPLSRSAVSGIRFHSAEKNTLILRGFR